MIYLIYGDNDYLKDQEVEKITSKAGLERRDGETIDEAGLRDILFGLSLFGSNQPVRLSGISQNDVSKLTNLNRSSISYYESGVNIPTIFTIIKLMQIYKITIDDVIFIREDF